MVEKEAETKRKQAIIEAQKFASVSKIKTDVRHLLVVPKQCRQLSAFVGSCLVAQQW